MSPQFEGESRNDEIPICPWDIMVSSAAKVIYPKYSEHWPYTVAHTIDYIFVPIAVETFGSWGPKGLKFIKEIGKKIQEKTGNKNATSHIIQAISMTVQRGNAISIMGTLGPLRKLEDFFDIISPREEIS